MIALAADLIYRRAQFADRDELFRRVGEDLLAGGYVKDSWTEALSAREAAYPTGLPVPGGVAIPHTDASHVLKDALVVVTLDKPIEFGEMGAPAGSTLTVETVFVLVVADPSGHVKFLSKTIRAIQDRAFIENLAAAETAEAIQSAVTAKLAA